MFHDWYTHSAVDGYLGCFQVQAIMSNAAMTIHVLSLMYIRGPISVICMSRTRIPITYHVVCASVPLLGNAKLLSEMVSHLRSDQQGLRIATAWYCLNFQLQLIW